MNVYSEKPARLLSKLPLLPSGKLQRESYCAGFECQEWRCAALADHVMEWIADYALREDELRVHHGNMYIRLREAAVRVYRSENYRKRGEIGEIILHAICREYFDTIPIAPRVFYKTSSNDVVKSFDMVHVRYLKEKSFELWLREAKFYTDALAAVKEAVNSISTHIEQGFLNNEKLLLGPQVSKDLPYYHEIRELLSVQTSLDKLFASAVFPVCIASDSMAISAHTSVCDAYVAEVQGEIDALEEKIVASGIAQKITLLLLYVPLGSKENLADIFDKKLKGFT